MSKHGAVVTREPCPQCDSRDNVARYEDGYAKCFGYECGWWESGNDDVSSSGAGTRERGSAPMISVEYVALPKRGISAETCRRFKYGVGMTDSGKPVQVASYGGDIQKTRDGEKKFSWINRPADGPTLFGQSLWRGQKRLVITEGELDALSYAEATDCKWPVVSVPDGASDAPRAIARNIEFIEGFEEVVFAFDMDEPGQKAAKACAEILTPGKARIASLPRKDANAVLLELGAAVLYKLPFSAEVYRPDGIVIGSDVIADVLRRPEPGLSYPWPCLDEYMHGQRRGEMVTWVAGTGIGKSQVMREVARNLAIKHGEKVGLVALEESTRESALGQLSLEMNLPLHIPEVRNSVSDEELSAAAKEILPNFVFYDHWGSVDADVLLPKIRYMVHGLGVRWIVLDHLSIMVSGQADEGDERKRLDALTTKLRSLCSELDIGLHIVSHLRKTQGKAQTHEEGGKVRLQDIRGSGAPAQLSNMVVGLERDQQAKPHLRNLTTLRVLKNRLSGQSGVAGVLAYDPETGRLCQGDASLLEEDKKNGDCDF